MNQDVIQVPFEGVAVRKLHDLFERGYTVCGVAIQRPSLVADADRGAITTHGMVMWWPPEQHKIEQVPAPKNLYEITGNVAHVNTVLIERAELHRLQAENAGVQALIAVHQRTLERCLDLKAECAELEAMLDAVGAGGVGESIRSAAQPEVRIRTSVPDGWKLVPVEPTDDMFIEGMEADCRGRPSIDDDKHVRSIWRAMLSTAPAAPTGPAAGLLPEVGPKGWAGRIVNRALRGQHVNRGPLEEACKVVGVSFASVQASRAALTGATA